MKRHLGGVALLAGIAVSVAIVAHAQTSGTPQIAESGGTSISFPVPELGNCTSKDNCRAYCGDPANIPACISFAKVHGLMSGEEADRAERFLKDLKGAGGPGGCRSPGQCERFCSDVSHIDACVKFAEKHGLRGEDIEEGKKIAAYIRSGGTMPGGCTSKESCERYCGDFSHAEECYNFAKAAGIVQIQGGAHEGEIPPGQFQKFLELAKRGETPGGCKSKDECEDYCENSAHFEECVSFAEKIGFVTSAQAEMARKTGGKGPGGCDSERSCEAYCNDLAHREECFTFAKERGFVREQDIEQVKEGVKRLQEGLGHAPPEVSACLKSVVGSNIVEDIQAGRLAPGPEIGGLVKDCFEKFIDEGRGSDDEDMEFLGPPRRDGEEKEEHGEGAVGLPAQLAECVKLKIGGEAFGRIFEGEQSSGDIERFKGAVQACNGEQARRSFPPEALACVKAKVGSDLYERILKGESSFSGMDEVLKGCTAAPCIQVITPARDPATGVCKQFPTPCDVPSGWVRGCD